MSKSFVLGYTHITMFSISPISASWQAPCLGALCLSCRTCHFDCFLTSRVCALRCCQTETEQQAKSVKVQQFLPHALPLSSNQPQILPLFCSERRIVTKPELSSSIIKKQKKKKKNHVEFSKNPVCCSLYSCAVS